VDGRLYFVDNVIWDGFHTVIPFGVLRGPSQDFILILPSRHILTSGHNISASDLLSTFGSPLNADSITNELGRRIFR